MHLHADQDERDYIVRHIERMEAELAAARDREKGLREAGNALVHALRTADAVEELNAAEDAWKRAALAPETHDEPKDPGANSAVTGEKLKWK